MIYNFNKFLNYSKIQFIEFNKYIINFIIAQHRILSRFTREFGRFFLILLDCWGFFFLCLRIDFNFLLWERECFRWDGLLICYIDLSKLLTLCILSFTTTLCWGYFFTTWKKEAVFPIFFFPKYFLPPKSLWFFLTFFFLSL